MKKFTILIFLITFGLFTAHSQPFGNILSLDGVNDNLSNDTTGIIPTQSDFTLETFINICNMDLQHMLLFDGLNSTAGNGMFFDIYGGSASPKYQIRFKHSSTALVNESVNFPYLPEGRWTHIAIVHSVADSTVKVYIDGVLNSTHIGLVEQGTKFYIGSRDDAYGFVIGYLDEFRISSIQRYTSDFTVPNSAFSVDTNTIALWHFDETGVPAEFSDASTNGFNMTGNGGAHTLGTLNVTSDLTLCSGSSVQLNATGANGIYAWSPSTGLDNANISNPIATITDYIVYTVSSTDSNSCALENSVAISTLIPTIVADNNENLCIGDSIFLAVQNITNVLWNTGQTSNVIKVSPQSDTTYSISGDVFSWELTDGFDLWEDQVSHNYTTNGSIFLGSPGYFCNNDSTLRIGNCNSNSSVSVTLNVTPNTPKLKLGLTMKWGGPINILVDGSFKGTISSSGNCDQIEMILNNVLAQTADGNIVLTLTDTVDGCSGDAQIGYLKIYSYLECNNSSNDITVHVNSLPTPNLGNDTTICSTNLPYTLNPGNFINYQWSNGDSTNTIDLTSSGVYSVTVYDSNGCHNQDIMMFNVSNCTGISDLENNIFNFYPNPNTGRFYVEYPDNLEIKSMKIIDVNGKEILHKTNKKSKLTTEIDIQDYPNGVYFLKINDEYIFEILKN